MVMYISNSQHMCEEKTFVDHFDSIEFQQRQIKLTYSIVYVPVKKQKIQRERKKKTVHISFQLKCDNDLRNSFGIHENIVEF